MDKKLQMKWIIATLTAYLLAGCESVPRADRDITLNKLHGKALVVASVTNNNAEYLGGANQFPPTLKAKNVNTGEMVEFNGLERPRVPNPKGGWWDIGALVVKELPPGTYEIYDFETPSVAYHVTVRPVDKPKIRFDLVANKATYIGNLNFFVSGKKYLLTVHDQKGRDFEIFTKFWTSVDTATIGTVLAKDVRDQ